MTEGHLAISHDNHDIVGALTQTAVRTPRLLSQRCERESETSQNTACRALWIVGPGDTICTDGRRYISALPPGGEPTGPCRPFELV